MPSHPPSLVRSDLNNKKLQDPYRGLDSAPDCVHLYASIYKREGSIAKPWAGRLGTLYRFMLLKRECDSQPAGVSAAPLLRALLCL
jgi:hypothetical protein